MIKEKDYVQKPKKSGYKSIHLIVKVPVVLDSQTTYVKVEIQILFKFNKDKIFNASTCGDNCAKWLLKIAESEDRTVNLRHLMDFGKEPFEIRILNTNEIVHSMKELVPIAGEFV